MEIEFLHGATGGEVTGSSFALTLKSGKKILIDAGMYQGPDEKKDLERNLRLNNLDLRQYCALVSTHPHIDHSGLLPLVIQLPGRFYATIPGRDATHIALENSAGITNHKLYRSGTVNDVYNKTIGVPYNKEFGIDGCTAIFKEAGHMLGSSSIVIKDEKIVVFSGDIGNPKSRIVRPAEPIKIADVVIMETTYGDRIRPAEDPREAITDGIERILRNDGTLIMPSFAFHKSQELLNNLKEIFEEKGWNIPVLLDGQLAIQATGLYEKYPEYLNDALQEQNEPFNFPSLKKIVSSEESKKALNMQGPKIVIAGSGMLKGGRIMRWISEYLSRSNTVVLFVGYPGEKTKGRALMDGEREIYIDKKLIKVNATILQTCSISAHADQTGLTDWLGQFFEEGRSLEKLILVHGNDKPRETFKPLAHKKFGINLKNIYLPKEGDIINLSTNGRHRNPQAIL